jgi:hypothetical protein
MTQGLMEDRWLRRLSLSERGYISVLVPSIRSKANPCCDQLLRCFSKALLHTYQDRDNRLRIGEDGHGTFRSVPRIPLLI